MATDYATLKKGGFMKQKQKDHFSLRLSVVGGQVTAEQLVAITDVAKRCAKGYEWCIEHTKCHDLLH